MEDYSKCYDVYRAQLKNTSDDFHAERETNLSAVLAALQMSGSGGGSVSSERETNLSVVLAVPDERKRRRLGERRAKA